MRIFKLSSLLTLDTKKFTSSLSGAQKRFGRAAKNMQKSAMKIGVAFRNIGRDIIRLVAGPAAALTVLTKKFVAMNSEIIDNARRFDVSIKAMSQYRHVLNVMRTDFDKWTGALEEMKIRIAEGTSTDVLALIGLDAKSLQMMDPEKAFESIIKAMEDVQNSFKRTFLVDEIFGGDGLYMLNLIDLGAEGLRKLKKESDDLNLTLSEESVAASEKFNKSIVRVIAVAKGLGNVIIESLLPSLEWLANKAFDVGKDFQDWGKRNEVLFSSLVKIGSGITAVVTALGLLSIGVSAVYFQISSLSKLVTVATKINWAWWASVGGPYALIAAAIAIVGNEIWAFVHGRKGIVSSFRLVEVATTGAFVFWKGFFTFFAGEVARIFSFIANTLSNIPGLGALEKLSKKFSEFAANRKRDNEIMFESHKKWREELSKQPTGPEAGGAADGETKAQTEARFIQDAKQFSQKLTAAFNAGVGGQFGGGGGTSGFGDLGPQVMTPSLARYIKSVEQRRKPKSFLLGAMKDRFDSGVEDLKTQFPKGDSSGVNSRFQEYVKRTADNSDEQKDDGKSMVEILKDILSQLQEGGNQRTATEALLGKANFASPY